YINIRDGALRPVAKSGGDFLMNQQIYKDDLARFVSSARDHITKHGIDSFRQTGLELFKENAQLRARIQASLNPFAKKVGNEEKKISIEFKKVGYKEPVIGKKINVDINTFKADSNEYFRKMFVNEGVTNCRNGITIDPKDILKALR